MTKEQWLENMSSNNPDYEGLLQHLDATQDLELVVYLVRQLPKATKNANMECTNFANTVLTDPRTNFILSDDALAFVRENEKT